MTRTLILDDDPDIREELVSALADRDFDVSAPESVDDFFRCYGVGTDNVILDLAMPGADGFEVMRRLSVHEVPPRRLIIISGHDERILQTALRHARQLGLNVPGVLTKPYAVADLVALLEEALPNKPQPAPAAPANHIPPVDGFQTVFQSKHDLKTGAIIGYEALFRPGKPGTIDIEALFVASSLEAQVEMTRFVLDSACAFAARLPATQTVAVNCTPLLMCAPVFETMLDSALKAHGVSPRRLVIELTEQASFASFNEIAVAMSHLALKGYQFAIDDFGRGSTALERIIDLPIHEMKIDKDIFWRCLDGAVPVSLLRGLIAYCVAHRIATTIEGVETERHRDFANSLGANAGQGYLWSRPKLASAILDEEAVPS